jgi:hypothetical protein
MKAPTPKAVKAEIALLEKMTPHVQQFSMFGDDNHEKIDAQIEVLRDDLDQDDIDERWEVGEGGRGMELRMSAEGAMNWRDGENDEEAPSAGWMILAKKGGFKK